MRFVPVLALLAIATPVLAQEAPAGTDQAPGTEQAKKDKGDKNDPNRKICRRIASSSSRLGSRSECHTRAEWDAMSQDNGYSLRRE